MNALKSIESRADRLVGKVNALLSKRQTGDAADVARLRRALMVMDEEAVMASRAAFLAVDAALTEAEQAEWDRAVLESRLTGMHDRLAAIAGAART
ncbi:MAG: hypothetical protein LBR38_07825 [Synergistaceae bacterium]|jgi:hypothetical protein|nr:hypothetical protein [Synergistaceae bacterium]